MRATESVVRSMAQLSCSAYVNIEYGIDVDPGQSVLTLEFRRNDSRAKTS